MAEYIEREAVYDAVINRLFRCSTAEQVDNVIASIPAADVRPVVRGKWVFDNPLTADFMCDNCLERQDISTPFCSHCGARMEGFDG